jgi:hypothetical protein
MLETALYAEALHTSVNGAVAFTGTGTNDLTYSGSCYFATSRSYRVQMDGTRTYKWSNDNGATWEATLQPVYAGLPVALVNAQGEKEGISIIFAGIAGHISGDLWNFTTTGQVVPNTDTAMSGGKCTHGAENIILKGEYSKGTETGLQIYFTLPISINGSVLYRPSLPTGAGGGLLIHSPEVFELQSSANFTYVFSTSGNPFYKIYAVKKGGTVSGLFTLFHEVHRTIK